MLKLSCRENEVMHDAEAYLVRSIPAGYDDPELSGDTASDIVAVHARFVSEFGPTRAAMLIGEAVSRATSMKLELDTTD